MPFEGFSKNLDKILIALRLLEEGMSVMAYQRHGHIRIEGGERIQLSIGLPCLPDLITYYQAV